MRRPTQVPAAAVFGRARRRLVARAAIRLTARSLWWLAAAAWCGWLVHRFAIALPPRIVASLLVGGVLAAAGAIAFRLSAVTPGALEADGILGARSLLVSALELDDAGPSDTPAARRIAREADTAAPGWSAELVRRLPVRWPTQGTAALLAMAAATILLALPGAPADPVTRAAAAMPGATPDLAAHGPDRALLNAGARIGDRGGAVGSPDVPPRAASTNGPRVPGLEPIDGSEPLPAAAAATPAPPASAADASATGNGDDASASAAGSPAPTADPNRSEPAISTTAVDRRAEPGGEDPVYVAVALDRQGTQAEGGPPPDNSGPDAPDRYYLSPAMSRYFDRYDRTRMEARP